jgi:hypothetical protein
MTLITNVSTSGMIEYFSLMLPPNFTLNNETTNNLSIFFKGIIEGFKINVQQINELYDKTKILLASGNDLDRLITDYVNINRKASETDENYIQRYIRKVFVYNANNTSIIQQVYDITGFEPEFLFELNGRNAYWGKADIRNDLAKHYFYDDGFKSIWGNRSSTSAYTGYIHLLEKPPVEMLDELCQTLNENKLCGTKIYLKYPTPITVIPAPESESPSDITYDSFVANWS